MGFAAKLDSNGTQPKVIKELIDAKLLIHRYGHKAPLKNIRYRESSCRYAVNTESVKLF